MTSNPESPESDEIVTPPNTVGDTPGSASGPDDAAEWRQANWIFIPIGAIRNVRGLLIPIAFVLFTRGLGGSSRDLIWYGIAAVGVIFSLVSSVLEWWVYRYRITDRDITLRSGIVSKQERVIPFERIQSVDVQDAPLERVFQVVRVRIDTGAGGGNAAEIELQALSRPDAEALRAQLLAARQRLRSGETGDVADPVEAGEKAAQTPVAYGELIRKLSTRELLIAGATSGRIGAAAAIAGVSMQFGQDLIPRSMWERVPWDGIADMAQQVEVLVGVLITLGIIAWAISIVTTVLTYGGFEIWRNGEQLQIQYGLLDRRRTTIPLRRIQAVRIDEALLRQPFGFAEIRFDSAGFGADEGARGVLIPLLPRREIAEFLQAACPEFAQDIQPTAMQKLPARARRRYIVAATIGWLLLVLVAGFVIWRWLDIPLLALVPAVAVTPLFALFGNLRFRDAGWHVGNGNFLLRWRAMSRVTLLTQVKRLQYRSLGANPLQRRADLATFSTAVASGGSREGFSLPHLDAAEAERLMEQLGHPLAWEAQSARRRRLAPLVDAGA